MRKVLFITWILFSIFLFFYSFTQVDLSLTLSRASVLQTIQKSFQYIGYYNRPLSTYIYIGIILFGFGLYVFTLKKILEKKLSRKDLWIIIFMVSGILVFSYNAFSYDLFNYIFDAKILTRYHLNPYQYKALDFPSDPMLSFMRWTHRVYPYGPFWIVLTAPLSLVGLGYFLPTFYLFKMLMFTSFLGAAYFIEKIAFKLKIKNTLLPLALFSLNPFILVESIISAHNDIVMMFFAVVALYFLIQKRLIFSITFLIISIAIKFATLFLVPSFLYVLYKYYKREEINWNLFFMIAVVGMMGAVMAASLRTNFQPWYLLYLIPAVLLSRYVYIRFSIVSLMVLSLGQYVPVLYEGSSFNNSFLLNFLIILSVFASCVLGYLFVKYLKTHE